MKDDVTQRLASLGYDETPEDGWAIGFIIDKAVSYIKSECNVSEVPEGLKGAAVDIVCGEFLQSKKATGRLAGFDASAAIKQISEGDTSITYAIPDGALTIDALIDKLINGGKAQFASYRKISW